MIFHKENRSSAFQKRFYIHIESSLQFAIAFQEIAVWLVPLQAHCDYPS